MKLIMKLMPRMKYPQWYKDFVYDHWEGCWTTSIILIILYVRFFQ
jgi:hypothetical protein